MKMSLTLLVSEKNAPLTVVVRMHPYNQVKRSLVSCRWLCQVVSDLEVCMHHWVRCQFSTAQGTLSILWRNPRFLWTLG